MKLEFLNVMKMIAESFGIRMHVMPLTDIDWNKLDFGFRENYYSGKPYEYMQERIVGALKPNTILYLKDEFDVYYYAFVMPEGDSVFLGPFHYRETYDVYLKSIKEVKGVVSEYKKIVPVITEISPLQFLLSNAFSGLYPEKGFQFVAGDLQVPSSLLKRKPIESLNLENGYSEKSREENYWKINSLLKQVELGNTAKALVYMRNLLNGIENTIKAYRELALEMNVLLRHTAYGYKVYSDFCEGSYQKYNKKIYAAGRFMELEDICYDMVSNYSLLIREHARLENSYLIRDCLDYVDVHFTEQVTLASEATRLSVSASYLSTRFQKEIGMNFVDYVNQMRIQYACILLEKLQLSMQRISELCGFSSSNYFARVFKQTMNMSPTSFRKQVQKKEKSVDKK